MTEHEAYLAMFEFLRSEYELSKSDDIGALIGSMSFLPDGSAADAAVREQWLTACRKAACGEVDVSMQLTK